LRFVSWSIVLYRTSVRQSNISERPTLSYLCVSRQGESPFPPVHCPVSLFRPGSH